MKIVAVIGASADRSKFGNKAVRAYLQDGNTVYPVNHKETQIEGLPVYRTLAEVPAAHLTRVSVYLPPKIGLAMLPEIVAKGCDELWLNPGSDSPELVQQARALGLETIQACSIVAIGVHPEAMES